jgi:hypothetical protein
MINFRNLAGDRLYHLADMVGADAGYFSLIHIWADDKLAENTA